MKLIQVSFALLGIVLISGCTIGMQSNADLPQWVSDWISEKQNKAVENPPASIQKCIYKNKETYIHSMPCCDQFVKLYDRNRTAVCAPSGGISGEGDGKCSDFRDKSECEIIWKDDRSYPPT